MPKIFEKEISRRKFISNSAKFFAACSIFNSVPALASEKKILPLPEFKTLEEMNIGKVKLSFHEMELRDYTGAIVIHHSGFIVDKDSTVQDIHNFHLVHRKWAGIGYHFVIHKDGFIEYARPLEYRGAHAMSNNEFTVGICLTGNYNLAEPPMPQVQSAIQLIGAVCHKYKFLPTDTTIFGHRDLGKTSCPGKNLYDLLPAIINSTQKIL